MEVLLIETLIRSGASAFAHEALALLQDTTTEPMERLYFILGESGVPEALPAAEAGCSLPRECNRQFDHEKMNHTERLGTRDPR